MSVAGLIIFFLIFGVVVIAHELGHMIVAKKNQIAVVEFSIGMGPTLFHFTKGGTKYAIRLLPLGGACMFEGEVGNDLESIKEQSEQKNSEKNAEKEFVSNTELGKTQGSFLNAKVGARIATVLAGPIANFILAFFFSIIIVASVGTDIPIISQISDNSPAASAGLTEGDRIVKINGKNIHLYREVTLISLLGNNKPLNLVYERDGEKHEVTVTPEYNEQYGRYLMGITGGQYTKQGVGGTLLYSGYEVKYWIDYTITSLKMLIQGKVSKDDVSGPVGMVQVVDDIYTASKSSGNFYIFLNMLNFAILLSANLGVLNLLPIPALDGGRFVFLLIEAVRGKPIPPDKEGIVHFAGFVILMILMVFVMFNDISRLFN